MTNGIRFTNRLVFCIYAVAALTSCQPFEHVFYQFELRSDSKQDVLDAISHFRESMDRDYLKNIIDIYSSTSDLDIKVEAFDAALKIGAMRAVKTIPKITQYEVAKIDSSIFPVITSAFLSESSFLRSTAAREAGQLGLTRFSANVGTLLSDEQMSVRASAASALANIGNLESLPALLNVATSDTSHLVVNKTLKTLGKLGNLQVLDYLRLNYHRFSPKHHDDLDSAIKALTEKGHFLPQI